MIRFLVRFSGEERPVATVFDESSEAWTSGPAHALALAAMGGDATAAALAVQLARLNAERGEEFPQPTIAGPNDGENDWPRYPWPDIRIIATPSSWGDGEVSPQQAAGAGVIDDDARVWIKMWPEIPPAPSRDEDAFPNLSGLPIVDEGWKFAPVWIEIPGPPFRDEDAQVGLRGAPDEFERFQAKFYADTYRPAILWSDGETIVPQPPFTPTEEDRVVLRWFASSWPSSAVASMWTEEIGTVPVVVIPPAPDQKIFLRRRGDARTYIRLR